MGDKWGIQIVTPFFTPRGDKAKSMIAKVLRVFYLFTSGVTKIFYKNKNEKNNFFFLFRGERVTNLLKPASLLIFFVTSGGE